MNTLTPEQILDLPLCQPNDADVDNVRAYLIKIVSEVWREGEGFSGKRPFGNSGWQDDLYKPLVAAGAIAGLLDEDGCLDECDTAAGDALIATAIAALGAPTPTPESELMVRLEGTQVAVSVEGEHVVFADRVDPAYLAATRTINRRRLRLMQAVLVEALANVNDAMDIVDPGE